MTKNVDLKEIVVNNPKTEAVTGTAECPTNEQILEKELERLQNRWALVEKRRKYIATLKDMRYFSESMRGNDEFEVENASIVFHLGNSKLGITNGCNSNCRSPKKILTLRRLLKKKNYDKRRIFGNSRKPL